MKKIRVGQGYDIHQLCHGREMWLGGVLIDHPKGLLGHSDADVLLHAICDALLGALALRDIGHHFPNTDERFRGISSLRLLEHVRDLIHAAGWQIINIDSTIIGEEPKVNPHIPQMQAVISRALGIEAEDISIKATTNEKLGALGRSEGIAALAVALLCQR